MYALNEGTSTFVVNLLNLCGTDLPVVKNYLSYLSVAYVKPKLSDVRWLHLMLGCQLYVSISRSYIRVRVVDIAKVCPLFFRSQCLNTDVVNER